MSSQNPITLGFNSEKESPSKKSNGLGFKDHMEESDNERVCQEIDQGGEDPDQ
jgi:hypothetical protein